MYTNELNMFCTIKVLVAGFETLLVGTSEATGVGVVRVTLNGTTEIPLLLHFSSLNDTAKCKISCL